MCRRSRGMTRPHTAAATTLRACIHAEHSATLAVDFCVKQKGKTPMRKAASFGSASKSGVLRDSCEGVAGELRDFIQNESSVYSVQMRKGSMCGLVQLRNFNCAQLEFRIQRLSLVAAFWATCGLACCCNATCNCPMTTSNSRWCLRGGWGGRRSKKQLKSRRSTSASPAHVRPFLAHDRIQYRACTPLRLRQHQRSRHDCDSLRFPFFQHDNQSTWLRGRECSPMLRRSSPHPRNQVLLWPV